jgi:hypothetical protein
MPILGNHVGEIHLVVCVFLPRRPFIAPCIRAGRLAPQTPPYHPLPLRGARTRSTLGSLFLMGIYPAI